MGRRSQATQAKPKGSGEAGYRAGLKHLRDGRLSEAIAALERALAVAPDDARIVFALGQAAGRLGLEDAAADFYARVLRLEPGRKEALVNLANLHRAAGRAIAAIDLLRPALEDNPQTPELWLTLGHAVRESGDGATARTFYEEALRLKPAYAEALSGLADLESDAGRETEALALYDKALRVKSRDAQLRLNRAVLALHMGRLEEGWRDYEWRLKRHGPSIAWRHGLPRWDGRIKPGLRLLVTAEQGLGDQILFASLLPDLASDLQDAGGQLLADCEPRLCGLISRGLPPAEIHAQEIDATANAITARYSWLNGAGGAGAAVPLASLARHRRPDLASFPEPHAYLRAADVAAACWAGWLATLPSGKRIGICWRSGKMGGLRAQQFAPLQAWGAALADLPAEIVSLQYDAAPEEVADLAELAGRDIHVPPDLDQKNDLEGVAGLMMGLDGILSAPTAVASLAAGLGRPTAKVLFDKSWTALGADYEPFQPACRLAMPPRAGDWPGALARGREILGV